MYSVAFLDSGVGGLPYLQAAKEIIPGMSVQYLADNAGFPYGTKTATSLKEILADRVRRLRSRFLPDALVIACNTASQIGLTSLRKAHPDFPIIGTVPAIKPAAQDTKTGKIGVMATESTVKDIYLQNLIAEYASDVEVIKLPAQALVAFVEKKYLFSTPEEREREIKPYIDFLLEKKVDRIVLACTHFLHVEKDIEQYLVKVAADSVKVVESQGGVAKRLAQILSSCEVPADRAEQENRFLLTSDPPFDPMYTLWAERFSLSAPDKL